MVIKDRDFLYSAHGKGDDIEMTHIQPVLGIKEEAYRLREADGNGWTQKRRFRHIAHIPDLDAARLAAERPGIFQDPTGRMIKDWLRREGEDYLTVRKNSI